MDSFFKWFLLAFLQYMACLKAVDAQFPRPCTTVEALQTRTCCPLWNGSPCGFSSGRGVCAPHPARDLPKPIDYRVNWPRAFYDSVCTCWGNYDGFDCSQCLPGWRGPQCLQRHHVEKKEITDLTDSERETFLSNLHTAKDVQSDRYMILKSNDTTVDRNYEFQNTSVYNLYVWMHYYSAKSYAGSGNNAAHRGPAFVFWHRVFLLFIEREIRDLTGNQDFYIPYWDWTRTDNCNICTNKYFGGVRQDGRIDSASRFSQWKTICPFQESLGIICLNTNASEAAHLIRNPGKDPVFKTLPTAADVKDAMASQLFDTPPYDTTSKNSFRNKLEGFEIPSDSRRLNSSMHNLVHRYLNGTMSLVPTAANDPIFMLHHSFIDNFIYVAPNSTKLFLGTSTEKIQHMNNHKQLWKETKLPFEWKKPLQNQAQGWWLSAALVGVRGYEERREQDKQIDSLRQKKKERARETSSKTKRDNG
uniref:Tyrosinase n=1 Tax=Salarias fasciatus TaxID=181472 RepID=A0A672H0N2_SALFA